MSQIWFILLVTDLSLRVFPFTKVQKWVERRLKTGGKIKARTTHPQPAIQHYHDLVNLASRHHLYPMTCLRQALVLQRLLADHGIVTELRFGTRKETGSISAHAWLEYQGIPISEKQVVDGHFLSLDPFNQIGGMNTL